MNSPYLSLKLATRLFNKPLEALQPEELRRVQSVAAKQHEIEDLILSTPEAANVILPPASVEACLKEVRGRYGSAMEFHADLERIGLDQASLQHAIARDMVVEAVLEKVAAHAAAVSDTEIEIFWLMHKQRFRRGETRELRHILITINDHLAGSERQAARDKIEAIRARLRKDPKRFEEQALKHSECPTAVTGGLLGKVPRGQLYPELEAAAFALREGALSEIVESQLGYHLLCCVNIHPERIVPLAEARETVRQHLEQQRRNVCQKAWIKGLRHQAGADAA